MSMLRIRLIVLLAIALICADRTYAAESKQQITVFAAASLTEPMTEFGENYATATGVEVRFSFASSSTLARQIEAGALPDVFFSANSQWMDYLTERDLITQNSRTKLLSNQIVLAAPLNSPLHAFALNRQTKLSDMLKSGERIAMGDPEHVPAGIYSAAGLRHLGLWEEIAPLLARTDNTRAALALVERGEAPLGFIYATDAAISKRVQVLAHMPTGAHQPIRYEAAILEPENRRAAAFLNYFDRTDTLNTFLRYGFRPYVEEFANE
jgi:molybdate transport system substrate-binding protein